MEEERKLSPHAMSVPLAGCPDKGRDGEEGLSMGLQLVQWNILDEREGGHSKDKVTGIYAYMSKVCLSGELQYF